MASGKEKNGIEEIYEKYYKDVYRFVLALSKNPHIAEDRILHELPEPYKEVFTLRVFGELRFGQIADIFGKTESWARMTYYYGDEEPRVINKIVYCHKDGTEVATLWEEGQNLPNLNSEK